MTLLLPLQGEPEDSGPERGRWRQGDAAEGKRRRECQWERTSEEESQASHREQLVLCPQRPWSPGLHWVGDQDDLAKSLPVCGNPTRAKFHVVSGEAASEGGRRSPAAGKRNSASSVPWAFRPSWTLPLPKGWERPKVPVSLLERRRVAQACQDACQSSLRRHGLESCRDAPAATASWELCLETRVPGKSVCLPWGPWDAQRWGRHSSATQSSLQSLKAGRPAANAQGWEGPTSGVEAVTATHRTGPPINLGPQQSLSLNLHLPVGIAHVPICSSNCGISPGM